MAQGYYRQDGREHDELRQVRITPDAYGYACASVLLELGSTKVLSAVTLQKNVPPFLKGKKSGWLTAEYSLLPASTQVRSVRGSSALKPNGRSIEISRLLGRSLRAMVDLSVLDERTIMVDCDVLQADGGTRTACLTAASLALQIADYRWRQAGVIVRPLVIDEVIGVSIGILGENVLLDLSYAEDAIVDADLNFVITRAGDIVEVQGAAEHAPISWAVLDKGYHLACFGATQLRDMCEKVKQEVIGVQTPAHAVVRCDMGRFEESY